MTTKQETTMLTGTTPSGTAVRLSHEYVADQFWKMTEAIDRVAGMTANLGGLETITDDLCAARDHWRSVASSIEKNVERRAQSRNAFELERTMRD